MNGINTSINMNPIQLPIVSTFIKSSGNAQGITIKMTIMSLTMNLNETMQKY